MRMNFPFSFIAVPALLLFLLICGCKQNDSEPDDALTGGLAYEVVEARSDIPAFIGYTEKIRHNGRHLLGVPERIGSLKDFEERFGGAARISLDTVKIKVNQDGKFSAVESVHFKRRFLLYEALYTYFANGGGECYIVSTGAYEDTAGYAQQPFLDALEALAAVSDVALLVIPEAVLLGESCHTVQQAALAHCANHMNRFAILDVKEDTKEGNILLHWKHVPDHDAWSAGYQAFRNGIGTANLHYGTAYTPYIIADTPAAFDYEQIKNHLADADSKDAESTARWRTFLNALDPATEQSILDAVRTAARTQPPSAAVAGIYTAIDRERGVWKAPANVIVAGVLGLTQTCTAVDQEALSVDSVGGKSINFLHPSSGKGILVRGAKTLDANSPDWRYIPTRRFSLMVEESARRATAGAVFETNDADLWARIKSLLDNYLRQKWKDGALFGSSPEEGYYVKVGLGSTMTDQDIKEGRLIIEVGLAVTRPGEFVILRIMHTMRRT